MSKPRYDWWGFVRKTMVRYPDLKYYYNCLQADIPTSTVGKVGRNSRIKRPTENSASGRRVLTSDEQRQVEAVDKAISNALSRPQGSLHVQLMELVFWDSTHTLRGAGMKIGIEYSTAKTWQQAFLRDVARGLGVLTE